MWTNWEDLFVSGQEHRLESMTDCLSKYFLYTHTHILSFLKEKRSKKVHVPIWKRSFSLGLVFQWSNVSRKSFLWFNLIGYRRKCLRMRTDHYLLEIVEKKNFSQRKEEREGESEALHQTNLYSRRMKLPVNRHVQIDQTEFSFFLLIRLICSSALKVSYEWIVHGEQKTFLRMMMMMMMIYCEIKGSKRERNKSMKIKSGNFKASSWSL